MLKITELHRIESRPGVVGGEPVIVGTRISVADIVAQQSLGLTVRQIVQRFVGITEQDVRAALDYYELHRDEIDAILKEDELADEPYYDD